MTATVLFWLMFQSAFGQGALLPPGGPAPTMKSLDQLEPRTPVDAVHTPGVSGFQYAITQSGSYYLTTNIVGVSGDTGIYIGTSNVTLDLNGFSVLGSSGTVYAIYLGTNNSDIIIRNGSVSGWINNVAVYDYAQRVTLEDLHVTGNVSGLYCPNSTLIRNCVVSDNALGGITIGNDCTVSDCLVESNGYVGIGLLLPGGGNVVSGNNVCGNNSNQTVNAGGIKIGNPNNRIEGNHVTNTGMGGYGIYATTTNNIIIRNTVEGNVDNNYNISFGNDVGPIGNASTNISPWGNISH